MNSVRYNQIATLGTLQLPETLVLLDLEWNPISDIDMLSGLVNLEHLNLWGTQVSDLTPLTDLREKLEILKVGGHPTTPLSNITPVASLTNLTWLTVAYEVSNISPLSELTFLTHLDLRYNPLNQEAHCRYIPLIWANNPGLDPGSSGIFWYDAPDPELVCNTAPLATITGPASGAIAAVDALIELAGAI